MHAERPSAEPEPANALTYVFSRDLYHCVATCQLENFLFGSCTPRDNRTPSILAVRCYTMGTIKHLSGSAEGAPSSRLQRTDLKRMSGLMLNQVEYCPLKCDFGVHVLKENGTAQPPPVIDGDRPESFLKDVPAAVQTSDVLRQRYAQNTGQVTVCLFRLEGEVRFQGGRLSRCMTSPYSQPISTSAI